jgi:hypothetical protein
MLAADHYSSIETGSTQFGGKGLLYMIEATNNMKI